MQLALSTSVTLAGSAPAATSSTILTTWSVLGNPMVANFEWMRVPLTLTSKEVRRRRYRWCPHAELACEWLQQFPHSGFRTLRIHSTRSPLWVASTARSFWWCLTCGVVMNYRLKALVKKLEGLRMTDSKGYGSTSTAVFKGTTMTAPARLIS